jgi:cytochrome c-type biogenesis protein CcmH/NrfG
MQDHYETLQVHPKADQDTIQAAYERLRQRYAPEKLEGAADELIEMAQHKREALDRAYAVLINADRRTAYDEERHAADSPPVSASAAAAAPFPPPHEGEKPSPDGEELIDYRPLPPARKQERPRDFNPQPYLSYEQYEQMARQNERGRKVGKAASLPFWGVPVGVAAILTFATVFVTLLIAAVGSPQRPPMTSMENGPNQGMPSGAGGMGMPSEQQLTQQFDDQITAARQVVQQVPDNPNAWINLGNTLHDSVEIIREHMPESEAYRKLLPRWLEASEAYREALKLDPDNAVVQSDLAVSLCYYGVGTGDQNYVEQGVQEAQQAMQKDGENGRVLLNLGMCLVSKRPPQTQEALEHWRKILLLPEAPQQLVANAQRLIAQYSSQ